MMRQSVPTAAKIAYAPTTMALKHVPRARLAACREAVRMERALTGRSAVLAALERRIRDLEAMR